VTGGGESPFLTIPLNGIGGVYGWTHHVLFSISRNECYLASRSGGAPQWQGVIGSKPQGSGWGLRRPMILADYPYPLIS